MFDFLPGADVLPLKPSLLQQAIAQVRFNNQGTLGTHAGVSTVHDALAERYPRLTAEQQVSVMAAPGSNVQTTTTPQYRFQDLKGTWAVVLGPEHATLETSAYTGWSEVRERMEEVLQAVSDVATLRVRERVGLRYVNHVPAAEDGSLDGRVRDQVLGINGNQGWRSHLVGSVGQVIAVDNGVQLALRHGLVTDKTQSQAPYLLDIDCSNSDPVEYEADETLSYFDKLNDVAYRCFAWCVDEKYRSTLITE
ncbi:TIGR04255 family protein [Streptomyces pseudovenezuelae]|uniref:TIGR04255 family protein n=1 Tax=Streptomyces pseudovenezuelae TaxID=67350 RepID=UPI0036E1AE93